MAKINLPTKHKLVFSTTLVSLVFALFLIILLTRPNFQAMAEGPNGETNTPFFSTQPVSSILATQTLAARPTSTLPRTPTATPTSTLTLTPTATPTSTKTSFALFETNFTTPYILVGLVIVISLLFFIILNARTEKVPFPSNPKLRKDIDENPRPIYKPVKNSEDITTQIQNELSDELINEFKLLRELYDITSKAQNDIFVSIHDLEILLKQKYPEKNVDLLKVAIEIANTQGGLLKIQQAREDFYLIQVL